MPEPALLADVIAALKARDDLSVRQLADGSVEVAKGTDIRRFPFKPYVSRAQLSRLWRWYGVPIAAFFPPHRTKPQTDVSGE
jgi:hypothetical protein